MSLFWSALPLPRDLRSPIQVFWEDLNDKLEDLEEAEPRDGEMIQRATQHMVLVGSPSKRGEHPTRSLIMKLMGSLPSNCRARKHNKQIKTYFELYPHP